jgi:hypothetical protein
VIKSKHLLIGAGAVGLVLGGAYLLSANRLNKELEIALKVNIHQVKLTSLVVRVDVILKNPTAGQIRVKYPFIRLLYGKENTLASSEVKNIDYSLEKYAQKQLDPIFFELGFVSLASNAPTMLKEYRSKGSFTVTVKTNTTINNVLPYEKIENITIGQGGQQES